ncbi:MAG: hypothetical protein R2713_06630 [Ilumatobacteraceae bacterium]
MSDGLDTATANVTVRLTDVNDPPVVVSETVVLDPDVQQAITVQVLLERLRPRRKDHGDLRITEIVGPGEIVNGRRICHTHVGMPPPRSPSRTR